MSLLNTRILTQITANYQKTAGFGTKTYPLAFTYDQSFTDGSGGNGLADLLYTSDPALGLVIPLSSSVTLDLSGSLTDAVGDILPAVKIKAVMIRAWVANVTDIIVGNATNPFVGWFGAAAHTETIVPGGGALHVHPNLGWLVTNATADNLKLANSGATAATCDIVIIGASA